MTEKEIKDIYDKGIFEMTPSELVENQLVEEWGRLVDEAADED